ncbi:MAG: ATP-grasp domain-containing protein [Thermoguttaceae bacterium]|nr:ATP-grasp domain-containing protein [Thermoguttaceae bacterium]
MDAFLIYDRERLARNRWFAETLTEKFRQRGWKLELKLAEELDVERVLPPGEKLPELVLMRCIRPDLSRWFEAQGVRVVNSARVSEICNDKLQTIRHFGAAGVPVLESRPLDFSDLLPFPFVLKTLDGHGGQEVFRVENQAQISEILARIPGKRWMIQRFCDSPGRDVRVYVIGNRIVTAFERRSETDFRSNYSLGGSAREHKLTRKERDVVKRVLTLMDFDFVGIDLIFDAGRPVLNEIEDVVGCRMVYAQGDLDILEVFTKYLS